MRFLSPTTSYAEKAPVHHPLDTAGDPRVESDADPDRPTRTAAEAQSEAVQNLDSIGRFTEAQIRQMQNDDAMAGGMVGMILTMAFVILLSLTICVNLWMRFAS